MANAARDGTKAAMAALAAHRKSGAPKDLRAALNRDPRRFANFSARLDDLLLDYSKCAVNAHTMALLADLAKAAKVAAKRDAMLAGDKINSTEGRAVLHTALRNRSGRPVIVDGHDGMGD